MAFIAAAAIGAAGAIGGAYLSSSAASDASKAAIKAGQQAAKKATGYIDEAGNYVENKFAPYEQYGATALENISSMAPPDLQKFNFSTEDLYKDPSYKFRLSQGLQAADRAFAKNRNLGAGNRLIGLNDYAQGMASNEYQNAWQRALQENTVENARLGSLYDTAMGKNQYLAGVGLNATGALADYKYRTGSDKANVAIGQGANTAAANLFAGQAKANAWNSVGQTFGYLAGQYMGRPAGGGAPAVPTVTPSQTAYSPNQYLAGAGNWVNW